MNNNTIARSTTFKGWSALTLENDFVSLTLLPQIGCKIVSIKAHSTGREFLWQDDTRPYRLPRYSDGFGNYDASGFDDCFPTIGECVYPDFPWQGITVPDHGELWCGPWLAEPHERSLYLHRYGVRFPYHFEKWITLSPDAGVYTIAYRVTNLAPFDFKYSWAAHPLFAAYEGMRIVLPGNAESRLAFTLGDRVAGAFLESYQWPWLRAPSGKPVDYSLIGSPSLAANDKVYADAPPEGWCALHDRQTGDYVALRFPPDKLPLLGICINHAGWPSEGVKGYWVALEPCTSFPDALNEVIAREKHATLAPYGSAEWSLTLHIGQAASAEIVGNVMSGLKSK